MGTKRIVAILVSLVVAVGLVTGTYVLAAPVPNPGCTPNVVPVGQANPPGNQQEPLFPVWCMTLAAPNPPTRVSGANDWVDNFDNVAPYGRFDDGDYDYRVFPSVQNQAGFQSRHFTNNQHWMDDNASGGQGGTMIRPNRSFKFENGKLVVEQDVAANVTGYAGDAWAEIDISNQPQPTGVTWDNLYGYGQFGGANSWTIGCRLTNPVCAVESPKSIVNDPPRAGSMANCFEVNPHRLSELSFFEQCGTIHSGGVSEQHARVCNSAAQEPDMVCRDRFRIELTASDLKYYVNGFLYFEDGNWPASRQIDPAQVANGQWYVYATDWEDTHNSPAFRYHWDNFAVNPHKPDGTFTAPSAAPNFCLGQPGNVCPMVMPTATVPAATSTAVPPTPTRTPVPPTSTPTKTPTVAPSATSTLTPTNTPVPTSTVVPDTCEVFVRINGVEQWLQRPLAFCQ